MKPITRKRARAVRKYVLSLCKGRVELTTWMARLRYGEYCVDHAIGVVHGTIEGILSAQFATIDKPKVTVARYHFFNETLDVQLLDVCGSVFCSFTVPLPEEIK